MVLGNDIQQYCLRNNDPVMLPQSTVVSDGVVFQELRVKNEIVLPELGVAEIVWPPIGWCGNCQISKKGQVQLGGRLISITSSYSVGLLDMASAAVLVLPGMWAIFRGEYT